VKPGPICSACAHPQRLEIERAVRGKLISITKAARHNGLQPSSLKRHFRNKHVLPEAEPPPPEPTIGENSTLDILKSLYKRVVEIRKRVEADPEATDRLRTDIAREERELVMKFARMTGEYNPREFKVFETKDFKDFAERLLKALEPVPGAIEAALPVLEGLPSQ